MTFVTIELLATIIFSIAVLHTFVAGRFQSLALRFRDGSVRENLFHLLGEVEVVFGLWAGVLVGLMSLFAGPSEALHYIEGLNFTEPLFVFAIMTVAATRPVIATAALLIDSCARLLPMKRQSAVYFSCLFLGPLLGSFITEPAAMTVTALVLRDRFFTNSASPRVKYVTLGVLFVNVSIGGVLTHFAAPPVLMVAGTWNWGLAYMASHFGWKAVLATGLNAAGACIFLGKELARLKNDLKPAKLGLPLWIVTLHLLFLCLIVVSGHHSVIFLGLLLFFLGVVSVTQEYQDQLKIRESLLVAFFLAGLVVLGSLQKWWLAPLISKLDAFPLFLGTTFMTAFTDNAALTYLGAQVSGVSESFKYALVAGAVAGGGMTVIANAPNPAGYSILNERFGPDGIRPFYLAAAALAPTLVGMACFWLLP